MNKQQLASTIWQSANQMRSKIEANEYKDYILGFMFYKYLSDREISFLKGEKYSDEDIKKVTADDEKLVKHISENIGYFIAHEDLFSSWLSKGDDFDVSDVRDALSNFDANIEPTYKKLFENIFKTLQSGLSKLGETSTKQTKSIKALLKLIKRIPMDGKQDYDILGFIYEYLISMFAANAGKKAGEFYTPHEVSVLMSEIVANHLKDRDHIKIYDPTSGSGSLLINIGASMAQYIEGENKIDYYAQELKENTYNLTRMNLVMRGINPANINVRNGDTLEDDWPFFETDENKDETYSLVKVDAVVSNPPYSQKWDPKNKEFDPRFKEFGVAPKAKADYAFLLHELYHLEDDGIMTIVLPHGVLFRGGEEETIRKTLIERNHIEAIIGLPANIFFGTGIPTIIMVLKRTRSDSDVLIIDASKKFEKVGKNNKLRARDIREIVDTLKARKSVTKFAKLVTKDDIRKNEYNLNIPRYVDSSDDEEPWDIHSIMFGGIPNMEIESLGKYWDAFPGLREEIFGSISDNYATVASAFNDFETIIVGSRLCLCQCVIFDVISPGNQLVDSWKNCCNLEIIKGSRHLEIVLCKFQVGFCALSTSSFYFAELAVVTSLKFTFAFISEGSGRFQYILSPFKKILFADGAGRYVFSSWLEDCQFDSADIIQVIECFQSTKRIAHHLTVTFGFHKDSKTMLVINNVENFVSNNDTVTGSESVFNPAREVESLFNEYHWITTEFLGTFELLQNIISVFFRTVLHLNTVIGKVLGWIFYITSQCLFY